MHGALGKIARKLFGMRMQPAGVAETGLNKPALLAQADRAVRLLQIWRGAVAVIDEVDIVLHPLKSELNWPLGDRYPLDFAPIRWEMPWFLLDGFLTAAATASGSVAMAASANINGLGAGGAGGAGTPGGSGGGAVMGGDAAMPGMPAGVGVDGFTIKEKAILQRLSEALASGLSRNLVQKIPHVILLSDAFYHNQLRPILADWLLLWLRKQGLRDVTDEQARRCLAGGASDAQVQAALSDRHVKLLNLGSDWLMFLLPHALKKVSRVHYGLLSPKEMKEMSAAGGLPRSRRYLAVPFVGKDAPSHASEFAHPDVAIGLTILAYRCAPSTRNLPLFLHNIILPVCDS